MTSIRMLVHLDWRHDAARTMAHGILRYAATHPHARIHFHGEHPDNDAFMSYRDWAPQGVIADAPDAGWLRGRGEGAAAAGAGLGALRRLLPSVRAVLLVNTAAPARVPRGLLARTLACDDDAVARAAGELFLRRGLRSFGWVGAFGPTRAYEGRAAALAAIARERGLPCSAYAPDSRRRGWEAEIAALGAWLRALPKPCGVLCAFDARALHVLEACRAGGLAVPEQVQVVGVDNEEWVCEQSRPTLTSVLPDFEGGGHLAAAAVDAMLGGAEGPGGASSPLFYGVRGGVERRSTQDARGRSRIVLRAQEFIRLHAASRVTAADLAKAAGCSASLLERSFRAVLGTTPVRALQDERLRLVRDLLLRTETPISEIGPLCGFEGESHLKDLFKRRHGASMSGWRAANRGNRDGAWRRPGRAAGDASRET